MHRHRFAELLDYPLQPGPAPALQPAGFVVVPMCLCQLNLWQQQLYLWAFREAQAVVRPSRLERAEMVLPN